MSQSPAAVFVAGLRLESARLDDDTLTRILRGLDGHRWAMLFTKEERDYAERRAAAEIRERGGRYQLHGVLYKSAGNRISRSLPT